jgi:hypothetical protein
VETYQIVCRIMTNFKMMLERSNKRSWETIMSDEMFNNFNAALQNSQCSVTLAVEGLTSTDQLTQDF